MKCSFLRQNNTLFKQLIYRKRNGPDIIIEYQNGTIPNRTVTLEYNDGIWVDLEDGKCYSHIEDVIKLKYEDEDGLFG